MSQPLTFIHEDSRSVSLPVFRVKVKKTVKFNPFGEGKGAFRPAAVSASLLSIIDTREKPSTLPC